MGAVVFRVDASASIGSGHVMRCAALATELMARGGQCVFAIRSDQDKDCAWLRGQGFAVVELNGAAKPEQDAIEFMGRIRALGAIDWVVVDHYGLAASWESAVRATARRILVIDDLANRTHDCDLLLDQNLLEEQENPYAGLVPPEALVLAGPRFALLRPPFAKLQRERRQPRDGKVTSILICFGGSDPRDHTTAAIEALIPLLRSGQQVSVIVGPANSRGAAIEKASRKLSACCVLVAPPDLPSLLGRADLVIGGGGTMTWERACLGVPSVAFGIAENQVAVLERFFRKGCALGTSQMLVPDVALMRTHIAAALSSPALLVGMSERSMALVDGGGICRVADLLLSPAMTFRRATLADSDAILTWRNHPSVRGVSLDTQEIDPNSHRRWMESTLGDPQRILLIGEAGGESIGVVRFDLQDDAALMSVYRVPGTARQRAGLIRMSVQWLRKARGEVRKIIAEVRADNALAHRAFRGAGFKEFKHELLMEIRR